MTNKKYLHYIFRNNIIKNISKKLVKIFFFFIIYLKKPFQTRNHLRISQFFIKDVLILDNNLLD